MEFIANGYDLFPVQDNTPVGEDLMKWAKEQGKVLSTWIPPYSYNWRPIRLEIAAEESYGPCPDPDECDAGGDCGTEYVARVYLREPRCVTMGMHLQCEHNCERGPLAEKRL